MNNSIHILKRFEKNTDANATNEGFFFQYLVTLDNWLENYSQKDNNVEIYCEVEDDIKIEDLKANSIEFIQVKAYTKNFSYSDEEILKSIVNFSILFSKYHSKNLKFIFKTNTSTNPGDSFFNNWKSNKKNECLTEIKKTLKEYFLREHKNKLDEFDKDILELQTDLARLTQSAAINRKKAEITKKEIKKRQLEKSFIHIRIFINSNIDKFLNSIEFEFDEKSKEQSAKELNNSILNKISQIDHLKLDSYSAFAHLITKVLITSQSQNIQERKLDRDSINEIIENSKNADAFKRNIQSLELLPKFIELCNYHEIELELLDEINERTKRIEKDVNELKDKLVYNPTFNSFQDYSDKIFEILNKSDLFDDKVMEIIQEIIPDNVLNRFKNELFYPILNQKNIDDIKGDLSKDKTKNEELWRGWLRFLVFLKVLKGQNIDLNDFKIELEVEIRKVLGIITTKKEKIPANLKFIFVTSDNFLRIATLYTKTNLNLIDKYDCCIFNTDKSHFSNTHFTNANKESVLKSITSSSSIKVSRPKDFGIINFKTLLNDIVNCSNIAEFEQKIKNILNDAITGQ